MSHQAEPQQNTSRTVSSWTTVYGKPVLKFGGAIVSGAGHGLTEISQGVPDDISRLSAPTKLFGNRDISGVIAKKHLFAGMFVIEPVWADGKLYQSLAIVRAHSEGGYLEAQDSGKTTREPAPGRRFTLARKDFFKQDDWIAHAPSLLRQAATELSVEPTIVSHEATSDLIQSPPTKWIVDTKPPERTDATPQKWNGASLAQRAMQNSRRNRRPQAPADDRVAAFHQGMLEGPVSFPLQMFASGAEFLTFLADAIEEIPNEGRRLLSAAYGVQKQLGQISVSFSDDCTEAPASNAQPIDADVWEELGKAFAKQAESSVTDFIAKRNGWIALKRYMDGGPVDLLDTLANSDLRHEAYAKILYQMWTDGLSDTSQKQKNARRLASGLDKFPSAAEQDRLEVAAELSNLRKPDDLAANELFQRHLNLEQARFNQQELAPITTLLKAIGTATPTTDWIDRKQIINRGIGCFNDAFRDICREVLTRPVELARHQETLRSVLTKIQNWLEPFEQHDKANMIGDTSIAEIKKLFALKFLLEKYLEATSDDDARIDRAALKSFNKMIGELEKTIRCDSSKTSLAAHTQKETTPELVFEMVETCEGMPPDEADQSEIWRIGLDKLFQNTIKKGWKDNFSHALSTHRQRILDSGAFDHPLVAWMQAQVDDGPVKKDLDEPEAAVSAELQGSPASEGIPDRSARNDMKSGDRLIMVEPQDLGSCDLRIGNVHSDLDQNRATEAFLGNIQAAVGDQGDIEKAYKREYEKTLEGGENREAIPTISKIERLYNEASDQDPISLRFPASNWDYHGNKFTHRLENLKVILLDGKKFPSFDLGGHLEESIREFAFNKSEYKQTEIDRRCFHEINEEAMLLYKDESLNEFKKRFIRNQTIKFYLLKDDEESSWFDRIWTYHDRYEVDVFLKIIAFCMYIRRLNSLDLIVKPMRRPELLGAVSYYIEKNCKKPSKDLKLLVAGFKMFQGWIERDISERV